MTHQPADPNPGAAIDDPEAETADRAPGAMDVVEGPIGSARLREPSEVEASTPEIDAPPTFRPTGG